MRDNNAFPMRDILSVLAITHFESNVGVGVFQKNCHLSQASFQTAMMRDDFQP